MEYKRVQEEFDKWAIDGKGDKMMDNHSYVTSKAIAMMNLKGNEKILDLGCGNGWATRLLGKLTRDGLIIGIDISVEMIKEAIFKSKDNNHVKFGLGNARDIPFKENTFDVIISVESFYYLAKPNWVMNEIRRVLNKNGKIFIVVDLYKENPYSMNWTKFLKIPVNPLGEKDYRDLISYSGLKYIEQTRLIDEREDMSTNKDAFSNNEEHIAFKKMGSLLTVGEKS